MHTKLFEVACGFVLQTPVVHHLESHFADSSAKRILDECFAFSKDEMASICGEAFWRSIATIYCALTSTPTSFDSRLTQELRTSFEDIYISSFCPSDETPHELVSSWSMSVAMNCRDYLGVSDTLFLPEAFSAFSSPPLLSSDALPCPGMLRQLLGALLEDSQAISLGRDTASFFAQKKLLEHTFLFFFRRRIQREGRFSQTISRLLEEGLWLSIEQPERAEAQLRENIKHRIESLSEKEQACQEQLANASQGGLFEEAQDVLNKLASLRSSLEHVRLSLDDSSRLLAEARLTWQSTAGDFELFCGRFGDLFEALHLSIATPNECLEGIIVEPREPPPSSVKPLSAIDKSPDGEQIVGVENPSGGCLVESKKGPLVVEEPSVSITPSLEAALEKLVAAQVSSYLEKHLENVVKSYLESRQKSLPVSSLPTEDSNTADTSIPSHNLSFVFENHIASEDVAPLPSSVSFTKTDALVESEAMAEGVPEDGAALHDERAENVAPQEPTVRELCFRIALEHRLWIEVVDELSGAFCPDDMTLPIRSTIESIPSLRIHGRSRVDKTRELLEGVVGTSLKLLGADGEETTPGQSFSSIRIKGGKWAFAMGARLFVVLKPGSKGGLAPWRRYKVMTYGKALAAFFGDVASRPIQLVSSRGIHQVQFDAGKYRFSRLNPLFDAYPELDDLDVFCLRQVDANVFHCDVVFRDPCIPMESPDFAWSVLPPPCSSIDS